MPEKKKNLLSVNIIKIRFFRTCLSLIIPQILFISSCGKTSVSIDESTYEPKIVIAAMLYPHHPVRDIKITRNFPVGRQIDLNDIDLRDAEVVITSPLNESFTLTYNPQNGSFEYMSNDLVIEYGKRYRLDVKAEYDGYNLSASSITAVPDRGMKIIRDSSIYGRLYYREKDKEGHLITPALVYSKSPNTTFYLASISAYQAGIDNFIYENPPGMDIKKVLDKGKATIQDFQYTTIWDRRYDEGADLAKMEISWFHFWFYSQYRIILYAADKNYYHFFLTHQYVQEIDGNLHEPLFDIEGDGIGYFASAVCDTIYMEVLKK
jgi:hypothetical protein